MFDIRKLIETVSACWQLYTNVHLLFQQIPLLLEQLAFSAFVLCYVWRVSINVKRVATRQAVGAVFEVSRCSDEFSTHLALKVYV